MILDADDVIRVVRDTAEGESVEEIHPECTGEDEHRAVIGAFLDWMDGGTSPVSVYDDNIRTMALTVAATHSGQRVDVNALLATADQPSVAWSSLEPFS